LPGPVTGGLAPSRCSSGRIAPRRPCSSPTSATGRSWDELAELRAFQERYRADVGSRLGRPAQTWALWADVVAGNTSAPPQLSLGTG
jgi:hypothetical protein